MRVLVTGSSGLIGSEAVLWFDREGHTVLGVDNNSAAISSASAATPRDARRLLDTARSFRHVGEDIRDRAAMLRVWKEFRPDLVSHFVRAA